MIFRRPRALYTNVNDAVGDGDAMDVYGEDAEDSNHRKQSSYCLHWQRLRRLIMQVQSWRVLYVPRGRCLALSALGVISTLIVIRQLHAISREYQGPLDHLTPSLLEPYYGMFCPHFSSAEDLLITSTSDHFNGISWECNSVHSDGNYTPHFPRIFMIGARGEDEDTFHTWEKALKSNQMFDHDSIRHSPNPPYHLERINTLKLSNQYALNGGALRQPATIGNHNLNTSVAAETNQNDFLCRKMKWEHRLFAVYQSVFSGLLATYPDDPGFVIIEDDAVLSNQHAFLQEVCHAHNLQWGFYSLYHSPMQWKRRITVSCVYLHGTVAFYIRRPIMEKIVNERRREWFCRFPIDMYISKMGPWYASRSEIVSHMDMGRVGSI